MPESRFVLSCEHGGNDVPPQYRALFETPAGRTALESHRGWDPGSLQIGEGLAARLHAPLVVQRVTRLLVECNRSLGHPRLWSEFSRGLGPRDKEQVLSGYWQRHRDAVRNAIARIDPGVRVVHLSVHTFTPVWRGRARSTQLGLLYDPRRTGERTFALAWRRGLAGDPPSRGLTVHLNRPYRGWTDGLTTALRRELAETRYLGLELEVSQALVPLPDGSIEALTRALRAAAD